MTKTAFSTIFVALLCLTGCVTQDQLNAVHLNALGHPKRPFFGAGDIKGFYENDLRRLLVRRASRDEILRTMSTRTERVPNEAYFDTFYRVWDTQPTNVLPATRAKWKQEYQLSTETYVVPGEDGNIVLLFFDADGRLWQYEHVH